MKIVLKILKVLVLAVIFSTLIYHYRGSINKTALPLWDDFKSQVLTKYFPCREPIPYHLGTFDKKFNLTEADFLSALVEAEIIWEEPFGKNLFVYKPENTSITALKVNLVYDYREQATSKLATLGIVVKDNRASYDSFKIKLAEMKSNYEIEKEIFATALLDFNNKKEEYNQQVEYWNSKGGAPEEEYDKVQAMRILLEKKSIEIQKLEMHLNATIDEVNSLVVSLNSVAKSLNLVVKDYNTISTSRGDSFEEGIYKSDGTKREIDIFEFKNREKLVRILAHELGHALGIDHLDDPKALMYKMNESSDITLTDTDFRALKAICANN